MTYGPSLFERIELTVKHYIMWTILRRKAYLWVDHYDTDAQRTVWSPR